MPDGLSLTLRNYGLRVAPRGKPGLFAGVSVEGTTLRLDDEASEQVYGHAITPKDIVRSNKMGVPATGRRLVDVLEKSAPRNESKEAASIK